MEKNELPAGGVDAAGRPGGRAAAAVGGDEPGKRTQERTHAKRRVGRQSKKKNATWNLDLPSGDAPDGKDEHAGGGGKMAEEEGGG